MGNRKYLRDRTWGFWIDGINAERFVSEQTYILIEGENSEEFNNIRIEIKRISMNFRDKNMTWNIFNAISNYCR